jgi:ATP-binding cassette subfamily D (ALD) long-chain fatty acid import protein
MGQVRRLSPPFSKYIAEMQKREGDLRSGHARLIANAEEVRERET